MIKITKAEKNYLYNKGYKFGNDLHRTYTSHPTYYCTSGRVENELNKYRKSLIVRTVGNE